jgi:methionyl-tRNA formyltransferase
MIKKNLIVAGYKAHASEVFKRLVKLENINIVGVFTGKDSFCLLNGKSIGELANEAGIDVYDCDDLTRERLESISRKIKIDILILVEWKNLIPESVYSFPLYGSYNIHDSLLPKYRGSSPMNWAIMNGESCTGATFYRIDKRADNGDVYSQKKISINTDDYVIDVLNKMVKAYAEVAKDGLNAVFSYKSPIKQNENEATYCAKRLPEDGLLDFNSQCQQIYNKIRALSYPFPGAFTYYGGSNVVIKRASVVKKDYNYVGFIPGYLLRTKDIWVLCKGGILSIEKIEVCRNGIMITEPQEFFGDKSLRLTSNS